MPKRLLVLGAAAALAAVLAAPPQVDDQTAVQIEALNRLKGLDLEANAALKGAVIRILEKTRGTPAFVDIVRDFKLKGQAEPLLEYALKYPDEPSGTEAFRIATLEMGPDGLSKLLQTTNNVAIIQIMGKAGGKQTQKALEAVATDAKQSATARKAATRALARTEDGARFLLDLAKEDRLPGEVKLTASSELSLAPWPAIKQLAVELLPLPQSRNAEPLPPVAELVNRAGDAKRGHEVFKSQTAACSSCHQVNGQGTDVGPSLSEIGTKLGKEALYEAILDPSSGISFGFEAWSIELKNGDELFGLITSETSDEITVKSQTGVVTKAKKSDIARRQKMASSLMPSGLQLTMSTQELVDLIEYLSSLKKPAAAE